MTDLTERLRKEQARLQRIIDTKDVPVKRKRALSFRLKMTRQVADEIERLRDQLNDAERRETEAERKVERLRTALERIKDGYRDGPWAGSNWQDGYNCAARVAIKALENGK